ncbi:MAG: hypothetical protein SGJ13_02860 [Actinomycetota bacterium]|nr:hypothetical protein [Actinomycetota bacterium]
MQRALLLLRASALGNDYAAAWDEWTRVDADVWDATAADGTDADSTDATR